MAGEFTPAPAKRRIAADLIDAALVTALTAPICIPMFRRMWREMKATRKQQPSDDFDPDSVRQLTRAQVLKWLFKPQKPRHRDRDEWVLFAFSNAYLYGQLVLYGRTVGQRVLGLRTVRSSDGAPPNWELPVRWGAMTVLRQTMPAGLLVAALPVRIAWTVTHPQHPWDHLALGITVIEAESGYEHAPPDARGAR
jgi:hypothetical protein